MVQAKTARPSAIARVLGPSAWIGVCGRAEEKWCPEEGQEVVALLRRLRDTGTAPALYVITPFAIVQNKVSRAIRDSTVTAYWTEDPEWIEQRVSTVHKVQGREADAVVLVLGAPDSGQNGARAWAGARPNLLNVAVTRAKETIYVVGNQDLWQKAGVFHTLNAYLQVHSPSLGTALTG